MDLSTIITMTFYGLSLEQMFAMWRPLILFTIGVAIYSIFVYKFYRFLARKKILDLNLKEHEMHAGLKKFLHGIETIILFPVVVFFWFLVMSMMLAVVSAEQTVTSILFISVAYVSAVRVGAYYNEDLSKDMAKLIPFALLAVFLIDAANMSLASSLDLIKQILTMKETLLYYLVYVIFLEIVLRIITIGRKEKRILKSAPRKQNPNTMSAEEADELLHDNL